MYRRTFIASSILLAASVARAQSVGKIPVVGYLWHAGNSKEEHPYFEALLEGFAKLGYVDGHNVKLVHRFPDEIPEHFKAMAAELVALNVDVLMGGSTAAPYLRDATTKIPIVFMFVPDPVGMKLVQTLARPGGNITGLSNFGRDIAGKRLQLMKDIVPNLSRVSFLINPDQQSTSVQVEAFQAAADQLGLVVKTFEARSPQEIEPAFDAMVSARTQAVIPAPGGIFYQGRAIVPKLAITRRLPLCVHSRETFEYGALVSYGPDQTEICRRSAIYADKILRGAKPGDLPVEQPTKLELFINLNTAKALGITVPPLLLARADEIIQ